MGKIGHTCIELEEVDSTNLYAGRMLRKGELEEGLIIRASFQSDGKGQGENQWESAPGKNLTFSVILHPRFLDPSRQFLLNKSVSLGVMDFLSAYVDGVTIKWPNDIMIGPGKVGGILIQHMVEGDVLDTTIVGIGLNINQPKFDHKLTHAASLFQVLQQEIKLKVALDLLCDRLEGRYSQLRANESDRQHADFCRALLGFQEERLFLVDEERIPGIIVGVDEYGRLLVEHPGLPVKAYAHKEIAYIR